MLFEEKEPVLLKDLVSNTMKRRTLKAHLALGIVFPFQPINTLWEPPLPQWEGYKFAKGILLDYARLCVLSFG